MPTPAPTSETDDGNRLAVQITIILVVTLVLLNVLFYVLSGFYYDDKRASQGLMTTITDATVTGTRGSFFIFSALTTATLIGAMFSPKIVGHGVATLFGVLAFVAAVFAGRDGMPAALTVSLVILGLLYPTLAVLSIFRRSRGAWAFLSALCWVLGVIMLFGAPKIRSQIGIGLWTAMIIPGMLVVAGIALRMVRDEYRDDSRVL